MKPLFSSALLAVLTVVACTDSGTSDDGSNTGGSSGTGTGGSGGAVAGVSGAGVTGGAAGAATGGASGLGGTNPGGASGASGAAGSATGGSAGANGGVGGSAGSAGASGASGTAGGGASGAGGSGGSGGSGGGLYTCPAGVTGTPLPATPMVTRVAGVPPAGFGTSSSSNVEGAVWIDGSLYVSHIQEGVTNPPPSRILKITGTTTEEFLLLAGTNGLAVNAMGNIVGVRHTSGDVATLDLTTKMFAPPIAGMYMTARFNTPNDIAIRRDGNIYITDPDFQAPTPRPQTQTRVYRISPTGTVSVVNATLGNPNGVSLSLDENTLYVATSGNLYRYPVMADGSTGSGMMVNGAPGSDGMVLDCAGNIYLTDGNQHRVVIVTSTGTMVGTIAVGIPNEANPTNVAFGGADHRRLFITTRGSGANGAGLYYIDLNLPGMPY